MNEPNNISQDVPKKTATTKRIFILLVLLVALATGAYFFFSHSGNKTTETATETKQPLFHRDEPVKQQIYQDDYKEKVHEMLDSGNSVRKVSRETGIRKDVVRKIKKEKTENK